MAWKMLKIAASPLGTALLLLRVYLGTALLIHGTSRIAHGAVAGFGDFLGSQGLPLGLVLAWIVTVTEILGSIVMGLGYFVRYLASFFILELLAGIVLVHWKNGWFVVGGGTGGMEYSILLIVALGTVLCADITASRSSNQGN